VKRDEKGDLVRVIVAGGGTGGHLFPGIAVADALRETQGAEVRFMGSERGIERKLVPQNGYPVDLLPVRGFRGKSLTDSFAAVRDLAVSLWRARQLVAAFAPDLAIGVGGYAAFPAIAAAWRQGVPIVLLEQNAAVGLTNRILSRLAQRICVSFAETAEALGPRAIFTGNPIRFSSPGSSAPAREEGAFRLLVFGGSAGARKLNQVVPEAVGGMTLPVQVRHQAGASEAEAVRAAYRACDVDAEVETFIEDMGAAYDWADLVICRAGASTIAELTVLGCPAILVPYPYATGDHQTENARPLDAAGAGWLVPDAQLQADSLRAQIESLQASPDRLASAAQASRQLGRPGALEAVVEVCVAASTAGV